MTKKILFYSMIVAVAFFGIGAVLYTESDAKVEPTVIQTVSVSMIDIPLEMLAEHADYAIVGEVISIDPVVYTDPDRAAKKKAVDNSEVIILDKEILSDVRIKVEEDLFGKYDEHFITVRIPGGEIPGQKTVHEASPEFALGERVIIFVANGQSYSVSPDNYTVLGLEQGTIRLGEAVVSKFANSNTTEETIKDEIKSLKRD